MTEMELDVTVGVNASEMTLADRFVERAAEKIIHNNMPNMVETISLPAALCDDKLLLEMNSIPEKMGFKIGEVADMLGIKQYVLRYWESEFEVLKPKKADNNQRYYTRKDVENAYLIRKLLHRDRFSIEGARSAMKELKTHVRSEVKKGREISSMQKQMEIMQDRLDDLLIDIRRMRQLF
jgi:DNA-binding transcriptional MerR regulator